MKIAEKINITKDNKSIYEKLKYPYIMLAPLSGVTDVPFRLIARRFGCKFAFTEMVDVNGIYYNNRKTMRMLDRPKEDFPLAAQLVGQDGDRMLTAAKMCEEKGFSLVDVNAGCPARKVIKGGKGSALLKDPKKFGNIVGKLTRNLKIPVTVKIRSGWNKERKNCLEIAKIAEKEGAKAICIHARTQEQMYKGKPDHDDTLKVKEEVRIPVLASGNIFKPEDAKDILDHTNCDGVMIARGALGKPWVFSQIEDFINTGSYGEGLFSFENIKDIIKEHFLLCLDHFGEFLAFKRMHKHICWYLKRYKNLNNIMTEYIKVKTPKEFFLLIDRLHLKEGKRMEL